MNKDQIKAFYQEIIERSFFLRNAQAVADFVYETVPFAFTTSMRLYAAQLKAFRALLKTGAVLTEEPALDIAAHRLDIYIAWVSEAVAIWKKTGRMADVRDFYAERSAEYLQASLWTGAGIER